MTANNPLDGAAQFHTTRWSMIASAGGTSEAKVAALEELCTTYWYPLYALARREGLDRSAAEDAVQSFFADLLSRGDVERADPERGRFRSFLGRAFRNHLSNQRDHDRAVKRGGDALHVPFDDAESRYDAASGRALEPDALFDRAWALTMLDVALVSLRRSYTARDQETRFDALRGFLTGDPPNGARADLAAELEMTEGALNVAIHRLRERYREALTGAVRDTVATDADVAAELSALFQAIAA